MWPSHVSAEAKDLVERLLKLKPIERLGAGRFGTPNDINQLLKHPYFKNIDLNNLHQRDVPLLLPLSLRSLGMEFLEP